MFGLVQSDTAAPDNAVGVAKLCASTGILFHLEGPIHGATFVNPRDRTRGRGDRAWQENLDIARDGVAHRRL
jgi:hypothetical protein